MSKPIKACFRSKTIAQAAAVFAAGLLSAHAQPFSGSSSGIFNDPVGGPENASPVTTGIGTSSITFGKADAANATPNALKFTGASFSDIASETPFDVGSLYYLNGSTVGGTTLESVGLDLSLSFTVPSLGLEKFEFPLSITTTPNNGNQAESADYITLPAASSTTFTVGPDTYTLKLSFGQFTGGGYLDSDGTFRVYEGDSATAPVEGIITTDLRGVPDNGSTLLLLGGASALLCCWRRRS